MGDDSNLCDAGGGRRGGDGAGSSREPEVMGYWWRKGWPGTSLGALG